MNTIRHAPVGWVPKTALRLATLVWAAIPFKWVSLPIGTAGIARNFGVDGKALALIHSVATPVILKVATAVAKTAAGGVVALAKFGAAKAAEQLTKENLVIGAVAAAIFVASSMYDDWRAAPSETATLKGVNIGTGHPGLQIVFAAPLHESVEMKIEEAVENGQKTYVITFDRRTVKDETQGLG